MATSISTQSAAAPTTAPGALGGTGRRRGVATRAPIGESFGRAASQFRNLNYREPGQWPGLPKLVACVLTAGFVVLLGYQGVVSGAVDALDAERAVEPQLKEQWRGKYVQAVNISELRKQKLQVQEYVTQLERQLPGKSEMDALLSDINQAGVGRGLQFELFRPGQVELKDYYAVMPIALRVSGRYHDLGAFTADISNLSRIVTLHNLAVTPVTGRDAGTGLLMMEATARTYRYLDAAEISEAKQARTKADGQAKAVRR